MKINAIWLDDQVNKYKEPLAIFEANGFDITRVISANEALEMIGEQIFDVYIIDIMLTQGGMVDGVDIVKQIKEEDENRVVVVLSAHLHQESFQKKVRTIPWKVGILEKSFAGSTQDFENNIVSPIAKWVTEQPSQNPDDYYGEKEKKIGNSPTRMSFAKFEGLPSTIRELQHNKVESEAAALLEREYRNGAFWVLICGSTKTAAMTRTTEEGIPDEEEILAYARSKGYAYFEFSAGCSTDDITLGGSCNSHSYNNYPTLSISFSSDEPDGLEIHFDTGCPKTLLSYESLADRGFITPTKRSIRGTRRETGERYYFTPASLDILVEGHDPEAGRQGTTLEVQAIRSWYRYSFCGKCEHPCQEGFDAPSGTVKACKYRSHGLIGRDILYAGDGIKVVLDGRRYKD